MKSKTNKYLCIIIINEEEVFNEQFKTLEEIGIEIGLSKNIIFDISSKRRNSKKYETSRFFPKISITRLP